MDRQQTTAPIGRTDEEKPIRTIPAEIAEPIKKMETKQTHIKGVIVLEPKVFGDERGYFFESFSEEWFRENVCNTHFVQDNESKSRRGVLRGLHFQKPPFAQSKLVRVVKGEVLDVAVDIRKGSPSFGQYASELLTAENKRQFFVPRGFAHGFVVLSEEAVFQYKCDNYYAPQSEGGIAFNDPDLKIDWQIEASEILLSEKDKRNPFLKDSDFLFDYSQNLY
jgi:dTDP-4-dehydrorhamnose 3,5-epimerase